MVRDMIFVVGAQRSGTTLFRLILDSHPRVVSPGEFDFLFDLVGDDAKPPDVCKYAEWLSSHRIFLSHRLTIDPTLGYCDLVKSFLRQKARANCVLAINIHRGHQNIPAFFPEAKYIHLVRDPRDVALSTIPMGWAGNAYFGVDLWIETERCWDKLASNMDKSRILEIKYEDLISRSRETLRDVCKFIDVDFDEAMLNYSRHSTYGPIHDNSVKKWKELIAPNELGMLEHKVSALLLDRGYELSGVQFRKPSPRALARLWASNKAYKWRFAANRYGVAIFFSERIARAFRMKWLDRQLRFAINEVDELHLK